MVVGHGLSGANVALQLHQMGKSMVIFDDQKYVSSLVAAGLWHPFRMRSMDVAWKHEEIATWANQWYSLLEELWGKRFWFPQKMLHEIPDSNFKNLWINKMNEMPHELGWQENFIHHQKKEGLGEIYHAGWMDIPAFLRHSFQQLEPFFQKESFDYQKLEIGHDHVFYQGIKATRIVFCEGNRIAFNPWFSYLPMNPAKGEVMMVEIKDFPENEIIHAGFFLIPLGNHRFRFGSNFRWDRLDWHPSLEDAATLILKLEKFLNRKVTVVNHQSGVRPANHTRRPYYGNHPEYKPMSILNALGSKGVMLAPFLANNLVQNWYSNTELIEECDIQRIKLPKIKEIKTTFVP